GFPGETEAEFEELLEYVESAKFERLGVFPYSLEPDTPAARLPGHLPEEVKAERRDRIMAAQQPIAFAFNETLVGRRLDVLIDGETDEAGRWTGRTYADAPDVDGVVFVDGDAIETGDLVACDIVASDGYDLVARAGSQPPKRRRARPRPKRKPQ